MTYEQAPHNAGRRGGVGHTDLDRHHYRGLASGILLLATLMAAVAVAHELAGSAALAPIYAAGAAAMLASGFSLWRSSTFMPKDIP